MALLSVLVLSVGSSPPVGYLISVALFGVDLITYFGRRDLH